MMKKMMKKFKNERGLTLVELLAVIVILAIVAVIAFVYIGGVIENSKKDAHIANAQQIISAAKLHEATGGDLPVTIEALQESNHLDQVLDPWDREVYKDLKATVTKETKGYQINDFAPNTPSKCKQFTATETDLAEKGRDLCEDKDENGD